VNANSSNQDGSSPLLTAAIEVNLEAVQLLLLRGAVCTVRDRYGRTPLHYVCWKFDEKAGRPQILGMFLELDGDSVMNAQDIRGCTPLHYAVSGELPECCELLLRAGSQASLSIRDVDGKTPIKSGNHQKYYPWGFAAREQQRCKEVLLRYAGGSG